ncbi:hypothetical protein HC928_06810 [bacterium]|nr:hypothetical protein [bacterium]
MIFWISFKELQFSDESRRWEISLSWSELIDGQWQAPRKSREQLVRPFLSQEDFTLRLYTGDAPIIALYEQIRASFNSLPNSYSFCLYRFRIDPCTGEADTDRLPSPLIWVHPARVNADSQRLLEDNSAGNQLALNLSAFSDETVDIDPAISDTANELIEKIPGLGVIFAAFLLGGAAIQELREIHEQVRNETILAQTPEIFSISPGHQYRQTLFGQTFFSEIDKRNYIASIKRLSFQTGLTFTNAASLVRGFLGYFLQHVSV